MHNNTERNNVTVTTNTNITELPNKGKINWGQMRNTDAVKRVQEYNVLRKDGIILKREQEAEKNALLSQYPGHFEKGAEKGSKLVYITNDKAVQTVCNEKLDTLQRAHREENKKEKAKMEALFKELFPKNLYSAYLAFAEGWQTKEAFKKEIMNYLITGLSISSFGKQGLEQFTQRICDAIGLQATSDMEFAKTDHDTKAYNEFAFGKLVLAVTRQAMIEKNVIQPDSLDKDEEEVVIPPAESDSDSIPEEDNMDDDSFFEPIPVTDDSTYKDELASEMPSVLERIEALKARMNKVA